MPLSLRNNSPYLCYQQTSLKKKGGSKRKRVSQAAEPVLTHFRLKRGALVGEPILATIRRWTTRCVLRPPQESADAKREGRNDQNCYFF